MSKLHILTLRQHDQPFQASVRLDVTTQDKGDNLTLTLTAGQAITLTPDQINALVNTLRPWAFITK